MRQKLALVVKLSLSTGLSRMNGFSPVRMTKLGSAVLIELLPLATVRKRKPEMAGSGPVRPQGLHSSSSAPGPRARPTRLAQVCDQTRGLCNRKMACGYAAAACMVKVKGERNH